MMFGGWYGVAKRYDRVVSLIVGPYATQANVPRERLESMWRQSYGDVHECPPGVTWGTAYLAHETLLLGLCNEMVWTPVQREPVTLWGE